MSKKILVVVSSLNVGGTENHIKQVFPNINGDDFKVIIYATHQRGVMAKFLEQNGVTVYSSRLAGFLHRFGRLGRMLAYVASTVRLFFITLFYRPHVVHCYLPGPYLLGGFCARMAACPHLLMSRRSMNFYQNKHPRLARYEHRLHKKTSLILANSKRVFNQLSEDEKIPDDKLRLVYNGIDLHRYQRQTPSIELKESLGITKNTLVMTIVANLFEYKGHIDLLKALVSIQSQLPKDWKLLCVGRDEGCLQRLSDYAEKHGISRHIQWLGQRDDVPAILSITDMGLLCSHEEGFSNSVIEGMALGLPMIVTDVGGNAEAVIHNKTGLVVPPKNPEALAAAILQLANDSELRQTFSLAAEQRVKDEFSLEHCVNAYQQIYAELH